jgi:hypothetical protein
MADSSVSVSGPVSIESDSRYRVAYDLMSKIAYIENVTKDRKYWLTLYHQTLKATEVHHKLESILKED